MINKITRVIGICLVAVLMNACISVRPVSCGPNPLGKKEGTSKNMTICGITFGEGGMLEAAKNGGITRISTVDVKTLDVLRVFVVRTTIVNGD